MKYENILVATNEKITIITINRPDKLNALNMLTIEELHVALDNLSKDESCKIIIITGSGNKAFVAGADISEFYKFSKDQARDLSFSGQTKLFDFIENYTKPVIAAINGYALGGGLELAMACHVRIASENTLMGLPEVSLGVTPGYGGTQRLPQLVGKGIAMELILSANMINVERGEKVGLLNHITSQENLLSFSTDLAKKIISNSSSAIAASIKCVNSNFKDGENGYLTEISEFSNCFQSEDFIEGTNAFIKKRKANFK
ncbi:enoyl-CoA hydratase-related protein [Flavobacteriaceae bacterium]|jgi:enoyl-CoA hydratase|nr:enoyl-CoA hydratase-related protein [Flavobacteriaceae bacterium]MDA9631729.1 enoyl-CoA hydratase-related protein [Bacteroidota bacterium]MDA9284510.1 enoyl-CoA hydratase-related protein [Flavobacteriaceae bacterium]MDA9572614.1 enoyl-CoA hydratase-related protein [Flavobacteriaceae bacterium]MDB4133570.1 enoyl-CoA hydratase-related protein [Flavobacteriaceae bacterium]|tara:strand:- start:219 stop:995 length:777 start_codon:yes stop_codon:yes gene_type:complete